MRLKIKRLLLESCALGHVTFGNFCGFSLELPWLNNAEDVSCIPPGIYRCRKIESPHNGSCFEVIDVIDRTNIQGHVGNFVSDVLGCIIFGEHIAHYNNDEIMVTNSKKTFGELMAALPDEFILEIGL